MLDDAEGALEIPEGIAPSELPEDGEHVFEPAEREIVWELVVAAELPDVHLHALCLDFAPRFVVFPDPRAVAYLSGSHLAGIFGSRPVRAAPHPFGLVMRHLERLVPASGVHDALFAEIGQLRKRGAAAVEPVDHDLSFRIDRTDRVDRHADDLRVVLARAGMRRRDVRGLVHEIEADAVGRNALVPLGEHLPEPDKALLRLLVPPEIVLFPLRPVDAVARRAVDVQAGVEPARIARLDIAVEVGKDLFVRVGVVEVLCPEVVVRRDADEVEALLRDEIELAEIGFQRDPPVVSRVHPEHVETVFGFHGAPLRWKFFHSPL